MCMCECMHACYVFPNAKSSRVTEEAKIENNNRNANERKKDSKKKEQEVGVFVCEKIPLIYVTGNQNKAPLFTVSNIRIKRIEEKESNM